MTELYGLTAQQWLIAFAVAALVYLGLTLLCRFIVHRFGALAARTTGDVDDMIVGLVASTRWYTLLLLGVRAAARMIVLPPDIAFILRVATVFIILLQVAVWGGAIIGYIVERYIRRPDQDAGARFVAQALGFAARFILFALLLVSGLQQFGVNITALVTGLGIGGIAVALALQTILGDLFAAMAIVADRPFVVGDFIVVGDMRGTVEHVGLKTTRIRSLTGEQVVMSNSELLKNRIHNYKRMQERRIAFTIDVTYDTPADTVAAIPGMIRSTIEKQNNTRFDRSHFLTFADSALRLETVYYVLDADYNFYADTQHAINLALLRQFKAEGIAFAFPTRTVHLESELSGASSPK